MNLTVITNQKPKINTQKLREQNPNIMLNKAIKPKGREQEEERNKELLKHLEKCNKIAMSMYLSIATLNVNGLNPAIKRPRVANWIKKNKTHVYAAYKRHTSDLKTPTN